MDEKYTDLAVKLENVDSRSKSNQNRLDNCEAAIKELREDQKAIIILANGVDKIASEMVNIKEDIKDVKAGQSELTEKVTILENKPAQETRERLNGMMDKLLWLLIGGAAAWLLSQIIPAVSW
jgi:50S ribosomal subunit-associated GTPase HflX